jgi:release factor glutamine methyltransferase
VTSSVPPLPDVPLRPDTTRSEARRLLAAAFAAAGLDSPDLDARFLLCGLLGIDGAALVGRPDLILGAAASELREAAFRRVNHEPVSRIIGRRSFFGRSFHVTPDVLDPRPETETVIEVVHDLVRHNNLDPARLRFCDVGTGSGALIVTLLAEFSEASGVATDISPAALAVAQANAAALGVADRLQLIETDLLQGVAGPFDVVVSNPPYIPSRDISGLAPEVRRFDPILALDGGCDGLDVYRKLSNQISKLDDFLFVVLEVGAGQAETVAGVFDAAGLRLVEIRPDLAGHNRAVALERQS